MRRLSKEDGPVDYRKNVGAEEYDPQNTRMPEITLNHMVNRFVFINLVYQIQYA